MRCNSKLPDLFDQHNAVCSAQCTQQRNAKYACDWATAAGAAIVVAMHNICHRN